MFEIGRAALTHFAAGAAAQVTGLSFVVMLATLGVNIAVVRYEAAQAPPHNSELLLADSVHTRTDVYATIGVLVSLAGVRLGYPLLDPIGGLVDRGAHRAHRLRDRARHVRDPRRPGGDRRRRHPRGW